MEKLDQKWIKEANELVYHIQDKNKSSIVSIESILEIIQDSVSKNIKKSSIKSIFNKINEKSQNITISELNSYLISKLKKGRTSRYDLYRSEEGQLIEQTGYTLIDILKIYKRRKMMENMIKGGDCRNKITAFHYYAQKYRINDFNEKEKKKVNFRHGHRKEGQIQKNIKNDNIEINNNKIYLYEEDKIENIAPVRLNKLTELRIKQSPISTARISNLDNNYIMKKRPFTSYENYRNYLKTNTIFRSGLEYYTFYDSHLKKLKPLKISLS